MSVIPAPASFRPRGRPDRYKGSSALPSSLIVIGIVCVCSILILPIAKQQGWIGRRPAPTIAPQEGRYSLGLSVAEARFDKRSRTIKGVVENVSSKTMDNVEVSYEIRDTSAELVQLLVVKIGAIGPHSIVRFESGELPPTATQWYMHEILGTPR